MTATAFDAPRTGRPTWMVLGDGTEIVRPVQRRRATAVEEDAWLLDRCTGPVRAGLRAAGGALTTPSAAGG